MLLVAGWSSRKAILSSADAAVWESRVRSPSTMASGSRSATVSQLIWGHSSLLSSKAFCVPVSSVMAPGAPQQPARKGDSELANQYMREASEASRSSVAVSTRPWSRSEEHTSELQSRGHLVCRLLLEKTK